MRNYVDWVPLDDRQIILARRTLYDLITLLSVEEFRRTEPSVEAIAVITKEGVVPVKARFGPSTETYYPVGEPIVGAGLFAVPIRQAVGMEVE